MREQQLRTVCSQAEVLGPPEECSWGEGGTATRLPVPPAARAGREAERTRLLQAVCSVWHLAGRIPRPSHRPGPWGVRCHPLSVPLCCAGAGRGAGPLDHLAL